MSFPMSNPFFQLTKHFQHLCHTLMHTSFPLQTPPTMPPQPACTWLGQNSNGHTHPCTHLPVQLSVPNNYIPHMHALPTTHTHTNSTQNLCTLGTMPCTPCTTSHTDHQAVQQCLSHSHQPHTKNKDTTALTQGRAHLSRGKEEGLGRGRGIVLEQMSRGLGLDS